MKFGKSLIRVVETSDPEWGPYWINYKFLKKKINGIVEEQGGVKVTDQSLVSNPGVIARSSCEVEFFKLLKSEVRKTSEFYANAEEIYRIRKGRIWQAFAMLKDGGMILDKNTWTRLLMACVRFYKDVLLLENFAIMNYCAASKILKKHDKMTGFVTRDAFMRNAMNHQNFTHYPYLLELIKDSEKLFAEIQNMESVMPLRDEERLFIEAIRDLNHQVGRMQAEEREAELLQLQQQKQQQYQQQQQKGTENASTVVLPMGSTTAPTSVLTSLTEQDNAQQSLNSQHHQLHSHSLNRSQLHFQLQQTETEEESEAGVVSWAAEATGSPTGAGPRTEAEVANSGTSSTMIFDAASRLNSFGATRSPNLVDITAWMYAVSRKPAPANAASSSAAASVDEDSTGGRSYSGGGGGSSDATAAATAARRKGRKERKEAESRRPSSALDAALFSRNLGIADAGAAGLGLGIGPGIDSCMGESGGIDGVGVTAAEASRAVQAASVELRAAVSALHEKEVLGCSTDVEAPDGNCSAGQGPEECNFSLSDSQHRHHHHHNRHHDLQQHRGNGIGYSKATALASTSLQPTFGAIRAVPGPGPGPGACTIPGTYADARGVRSVDELLLAADSGAEIDPTSASAASEAPGGVYTTGNKEPGRRSAKAPRLQ